MLTIETTPGCGQTPSVVLLLEERGVPYTLVVKDKGHFMATYHRPGPRLVDGAFTLMEAGAIMRHIERMCRDDADADGDNSSRIDEWGSLASRMALSALNARREMMEKNDARPARIKEEREKIDNCLRIVDAALADRFWLLGEWTAADAAFGHLSRFGGALELERFPRVHAWVARMQQRPAWQRAQAALAAAQPPARHVA